MCGGMLNHSETLRLRGCVSCVFQGERPPGSLHQGGIFDSLKNLAVLYNTSWSSWSCQCALLAQKGEPSVGKVGILSQPGGGGLTESQLFGKISQN